MTTYACSHTSYILVTLQNTVYTYGGFHFESGSLKISLLEELACYQMDNLKNEEFNVDNSRTNMKYFNRRNLGSFGSYDVPDRIFSVSQFLSESLLKVCNCRHLHFQRETVACSAFFGEWLNTGNHLVPKFSLQQTCRFRTKDNHPCLADELFRVSLRREQNSFHRVFYP